MAGAWYQESVTWALLCRLGAWLRVQGSGSVLAGWVAEAARAVRAAGSTARRSALGAAAATWLLLLAVRVVWGGPSEWLGPVVATAVLGAAWSRLRGRQQGCAADGHAHHHHEETREQIAAEWRDYWRRQPRIPAWDYTSEIVLENLMRACGPVAGRHMLEAGCGTGRISLALARQGARVTGIDLSPDAVTHTGGLLAEAGQPGRVMLASLFALPFPDGEFDIVWNAGVLEHFSEPERTEALRELLRVTRPGGLVVTLNPYRYALLYRVGKWLSERLGRWPYGHEDPIASLGPASRPLACEAAPEYSTGFYLIAIEALRAVPWLQPLVERLRAGMVSWHRSRLGGWARGTDRMWSRLLGGYLLVSVFRKSGRAAG